MYHITEHHFPCRARCLLGRGLIFRYFPDKQSIGGVGDATDRSGRGRRAEQEEAQPDQDLQVHASHLHTQEPGGAVPTCG